MASTSEQPAEGEAKCIDDGIGLEETLKQMSVEENISIEEARTRYERVVSQHKKNLEENREMLEQQRRYQQLMPTLLNKVDTFRDRVDELTLETFEQNERELLTFMQTFYRQNHYAYVKMSTPVMATYMLWCAKRWMLLLRDRTLALSDDPQMKAEAESLDTQRFELPQKGFLDEFYLDMVGAFERKYYNPVKILRYEDMLYPHKYEDWQRVIPDAVHKWLIQSAEEMSKDFDAKRKSGEFRQANVDDQYVEQWRRYLQQMRDGKLPWGFYTEREADCPRETLDYADMLNPKNGHVFERTISLDVFENLKKRADAQLEALLQLPDETRESSAIKELIEHLQTTFCADEPRPPFGFEIVDDRMKNSVFYSEQEEKGEKKSS